MRRRRPRADAATTTPRGRRTIRRPLARVRHDPRRRVSSIAGRAWFCCLWPVFCGPGVLNRRAGLDVPSVAVSLWAPDRRGNPARPATEDKRGPRAQRGPVTTVRPARASVRWAEATTAASTKRPSGRASAPASARAASTISCAASISCGVGRNARSITGSCRGWIAARPRNPSARPCAQDAHSPSRSRTSGNTDWAGGASPAARHATTARLRDQSSPASSRTPRSARRSASPSAMDRTCGWAAATEYACSMPSADSSSGQSATPGASAAM